MARKRVSVSEDFEMAYLGQAYANRVRPDVPTDWFKNHQKTVYLRSSSFFYKNSTLLLEVGMDRSDVLSIASCYLSFYLSHESVMIEGGKKNLEFTQKYIEISGGLLPTKEELETKDRADFALFLNQRLISLARVANSKAHNILGIKYVDVLYRVAPHAVIKDMKAIALMNRVEKENAGYFRLSQKEARLITKQKKYVDRDSPFVCNGVTYVKVNESSSGNPAELYENIEESLEEDQTLFDLKHRFETLPKFQKILLLKKIIRQKNSKNCGKTEKALARQMLAQLTEEE